MTLALGFLFFEELMEGFKRHKAMFVVTITSMGIAIGTGWELVEWLVQFSTPKNMLGTTRDTMVDLALDSAGAFLAALLNLSGLNEHR